MAKNCNTIVLSNCPPVTCDACKEIYSAVCVKYFGTPIGDIASNGDTLVEILQNINILLADAGGCSNPPTQFVYAGSDGDCTGDALATRVQSNGYTNLSRNFNYTANLCRIQLAQIVIVEALESDFSIGDEIEGNTSGAIGTVVALFLAGDSVAVAVQPIDTNTPFQDENITNNTQSGTFAALTSNTPYIDLSSGDSIFALDGTLQDLLGTIDIILLNGNGSYDVRYTPFEGEDECPTVGSIGMLIVGEESQAIFYISSVEQVESVTGFLTGFQTMPVDLPFVEDDETNSDYDGSYLRMDSGDFQDTRGKRGVFNIFGNITHIDYIFNNSDYSYLDKANIRERIIEYTKDSLPSSLKTTFFQDALEISIGANTSANGGTVGLGATTKNGIQRPFFQTGVGRFHFPDFSVPPSPGDIMEIDYINGTDYLMKWSTPPPTVLEYICTLDQVGTGNPTEQAVIYNTLGGNITWTRNNVGEYTGILPSTFDHTKMTVSLLDGANDGNVYIYSVWKGDTTIKIYAQTGGAPNDDSLRNASFQLKIYP